MTWAVTNSDGETVATVRFGPYGYSMSQPNPGVDMILNGVRDVQQMNRTPAEREVDPETATSSPETLQDPSDDFRRTWIASALAPNYTLSERPEGAAKDGPVEVAAFDPDVHPRGPDGKFVEKLDSLLSDMEDHITGIDVDAEDEDMGKRAKSKFVENAETSVSRFKDPEVANATFQSIGDLFVNEFRTGINFSAGRDKERSSFEVQPAARSPTFHHEFGHAIADGHGYGISVDAAREADTRYDSDEDNFVPVDLDRDDLDEFKLTQLEDGDPPDEVQRLMEAVNDAWEETQRVGQEDSDELVDYVPKTNYGALNAHEFLGQLHEELQGDTLPRNANWFYRYDDLLPAYLDVAEPSDRVKELITFLHNNREGSPFDEDPYPDIEPEV